MHYITWACLHNVPVLYNVSFQCEEKIKYKGRSMIEVNRYLVKSLRQLLPINRNLGWSTLEFPFIK